MDCHGGKPPRNDEVLFLVIAVFRHCERMRSNPVCNGTREIPGRFVPKRGMTVLYLTYAFGAMTVFKNLQEAGQFQKFLRGNFFGTSGWGNTNLFKFVGDIIE